MHVNDAYPLQLTRDSESADFLDLPFLASFSTAPMLAATNMPPTWKVRQQSSLGQELSYN